MSRLLLLSVLPVRSPFLSYTYSPTVQCTLVPYPTTIFLRISNSSFKIPLSTSQTSFVSSRLITSIAKYNSLPLPNLFFFTSTPN
ncbi:hypothetical protein O3M35_002684 [Rhynocoris fuscipes]|uniref:Secreted protein n=1 Tax=Rhynocoris fuscipes TaxID=488301 RepID=A0AAW1CSX6_9HEMI